MSFFSIVGEKNEMTEDLKKWAGIEELDFPRPRAIYAKKKKPIIVVQTRTGGNNREEYEEQNNEITKHPNYLYDKDWDDDQSYALFYFKIKQEYIDDWDNHIKNLKE